MAARSHRVKLSDEWRERIRVAGILQRLEKAAMGEGEVTPTQLKAAEIVLRKTLPDLARTEVTGKDGGEQSMTIRWGAPVD